MQQEQFCQYYQAYVDRAQCWFVVSTLKQLEHVVFDRTIDAASNLFEFFVPAATEDIFLQVIDRFVQEGLVRDLKKMQNRLQDPDQEV